MAQRPCWAEVSLTQLKENFGIVRRGVALRVPQGDPERVERVGAERKVLTVVKADGYGHGAVPVARALEQAGADMLGVASVNEAVELRAGGLKAPILVLTGFFPDEERELLERDITPGITELGQLERFEQAARAAGRRRRIHVKIDTGMGRLGVPVADVPRLLDALAASASLELEGLYTHFASAEDFTSQQTDQQVAAFETARQQLAARGFRPPLIHLANTGAIVGRPETWGTMVRPGSMLYGYLSFFQFPAGLDRTAELAAKFPVKPVLTLKVSIFQVRDYPAGAPLGYGARFVTRRASRIAVLPVGYGDGWRRGLSGSARALLRGQYAPLVGTIGMDLTLADVTDVPGAAPGDEVMLIGLNGAAAIPPTEVALALGTVASEVLTGLSKRVPRIYVD